MHVPLFKGMKRQLVFCILILCVTLLTVEQTTALGAVNGDYTVRVIIEHVTALDSLDTLGSADFYADITINGVTMRTPVVLDDNDIQPNWSHVVQVPVNRADVAIEIALWDQDGGLNGADDHVDIQGESGRNLVFTVNLASCNHSCVTVLSSSGTDNDQASIQLRTEVTKLPDPYSIYLPYIVFR